MPNHANFSSAVAEPLERLISVFNHTFDQERTRLKGGGTEPEYIPAADARSYAQIVFTRDYFASALHEVAHWCIAGEERRKQLDYGYWYEADGRSPQQQREFEQVEVAPQALEWIFSQACGVRFQVSSDNLAKGVVPGESFKRNIWHKVQRYCAVGLSERPRRFAQSLAVAFSRSDPCDGELYVLEML